MYIQAKNLYPYFFKNEKARMVMLIDATGSMTTMLGKLKLILPEIFEDVYKILNDKKV